MNEFILLLQAKLDEASKSGINAEIKALQGQLDKLKVQAEIDPKSLVSIKNAIDSLANGNNKIKLEIDTEGAVSSIENISKTANKAGQQAGKSFGSNFSNNLQSSLNTVKANISNTLKSFDSKKIRSYDIASMFNLDRSGIDDSVRKTISDVVNELRTLEKEIFKTGSDDAWAKLVGNINKIHDLVSQYGKSRDMAQFKESLDIADYFQGKKIFVGSQNDVLSSTGKTIRELNQMFLGLGVSFTTVANQSTKLDSVWDELFSLSPDLQGIIAYSDQLAAIVKLLELAKDAKFGETGLLPVNIGQLEQYLLDYAKSIDDTRNRLRMYSSEQAEIEQRISQEASSSADVIVQNEERKQQAYKETANVRDQVESEQSLIKTGRNSVSFAQSNDAAREAATYFAELLQNEKAAISVTEEFGSSNSLTSFAVNIKRASGEVETLRYSLQEVLDADANPTGIFEFVNSGSEIKNLGVIQQVQSIENAITNYNKKISQFKSVNSEILSGLSDPLSKFDTALSGLKNGTATLDDVANAFNDLNTAASNITKNFSRQLSPIDSAIRKLSSGEQAIAGLRAEFQGLDNAPKEVNAELDRCADLLRNVKQIESEQGRTAEWAAAYREWSDDLDGLTVKLRTLKKEEANSVATPKLLTKANILTNDIVSWMDKNTAAAEAFGDELRNIIEQLKSVSNNSDFDKLSLDFRNIKSEAKAQGLVKSGLSSTLKSTMLQYVGLDSAMDVLQHITEFAHNAVDAVIEVDTAMTNLYKVTDESAASYQKFVDSAGDAAKSLGRDMSSYIEQTSEWAKLGYDFADSQELAKLSSIYANVGEVDDKTAVSDMVTAMKSFNIEASDAMTIIDSLNKLGNEFATDSASLGDALSRSAASMHTAGSDIHETLAMITGGAEITQNANEFGNFLKIASMRIRGMKGELEELGETVDENVDSISKVQTQILNLTGGKVNIFDENGEFRDYYAIMEEISAIHDQLSSTEQASLDEILFGKQRANQGAALIQAFQSGQVQKALEASQNAAGSAQAEQEKWMDSIEARLQKFQATWQDFANSFVSSDLVKGIVDFGTSALDVLDDLVDKYGAVKTLFAGGAAALGITALVKNFGNSNEFALYGCESIVA